MKNISIAWSPNTQLDDFLLAVSLVFRPWVWFGNKEIKKLNETFSNYVGQECFLFDSGRSSLYAILKSLEIGLGNEILLQGFTCVALPNPILWAGAKPVYVDTDITNFQIDLVDLEKKITPKTKALVIQYTFGISPDLIKIKKICEKYKILLIEDCCHNLGQKIILEDGKSKLSGTIGDAAIYSFGMEKIISGTRGGVATISNSSERHEKAITNLRKMSENLSKPRVREILRGLFNSIVWKSKEKLGLLGELIYLCMTKLKLHELGLTVDELNGKKPKHLPYSMPNTNAVLVLHQLKKMEKYNRHRIEIANRYDKKFKIANIKTISQGDFDNENLNILILDDPLGNAVWLRYPILVRDAEKLREKAKKENIILGNWYTKVIHCKGVDLCALGYKEGVCPKSEWLTKHIVNLPTHQSIDAQDVDRIVNFVLENA